MGYYVDLSRISLDEFRQVLKTTDLIPSMRGLLDHIDERFDLVKAQGIQNLHELQQVLKTKDKVQRLAATLPTVPVEYLTLLRREVNSYHPQARKIANFACLSEATRDKLIAARIKTTKTLYDRILTPAERNTLREQLDLTEDEVLLLAKLVDVSRLRYVNPAFATLLVFSSFDTVEKIKRADCAAFYANLLTLNDERAFFGGAISERDMHYLVTNAGYVALDIVY